MRVRNRAGVTGLTILMHLGSWRNTLRQQSVGIAWAHRIMGDRCRIFPLKAMRIVPVAQGCARSDLCGQVVRHAC